MSNPRIGFDDDEFPILPQGAQDILRAIGCRVDTLATCGNCGCVTEIGHRCDNCGRIVGHL